MRRPAGPGIYHEADRAVRYVPPADEAASAAAEAAGDAAG